MSVLSSIGLAPQLTVEEQQRITEFRQNYIDYLNAEQGRTTSDTSLAPESLNAILKQIKDAQTFLQNNPTANILNLQSARDAFTIAVKQIRDIDAPKKTIQNLINGIPAIVNFYGQQKKLLTSAEQINLISIKNSLQSWIYSNSAATVLDLKAQIATVKNNIINAISDESALASIKSELSKFETMTVEETKKMAAKLDKVGSALKNSTLDIVDVGKTVFSVTIKVFTSLLLISLLVFAGSLAANQAIGREPTYRILYFLWAAIPVFAPFVLIQSLLKRMSSGPIRIYGILPISTVPAVSRLGKLLWYPFYWVPDLESKALEDSYNASVKAFAVA